MTALKKIKTANLSVQDLPSSHSDWHELSLFALSFDPAEELGNTTWSEDILSRNLKDLFSLQELRTYLYFMQRWWNNKLTPISVEALDDMHKAVELMRLKLSNKEKLG